VTFEPKQRVPTERKTSNVSNGGDPPSPGNWRSFPHFERLLNVLNPPLVGSMQATCRQLESILNSGSPQEKSRARAVMTAYIRTLELYRRFANSAAAEGPQPGNLSRGPHDK
jgi:hypothetical protein